MWHEEHFWNISVFQRVSLHLSYLVNLTRIPNVEFSSPVNARPLTNHETCLFISLKEHLKETILSACPVECLGSPRRYQQVTDRHNKRLFYSVNKNYRANITDSVPLKKRKATSWTPMQVVSASTVQAISLFLITGNRRIRNTVHEQRYGSNISLSLELWHVVSSRKWSTEFHFFVTTVSSLWTRAAADRQLDPRRSNSFRTTSGVLLRERSSKAGETSVLTPNTDMERLETYFFAYSMVQAAFQHSTVAQLVNTFSVCFVVFRVTKPFSLSHG
jgi:hypothetical protein